MVHPEESCSMFPASHISFLGENIAQKIQICIKESVSKCDQIHRKLQIFPYLLKSLMENSIFCVMKQKKSMDISKSKFFWLSWRLLQGLRNYNRKLFLCPPQIGENTIKISNCCFSKSVYTLPHQTKYLY